MIDDSVPFFFPFAFFEKRYVVVDGVGSSGHSEFFPPFFMKFVFIEF